MAIHPDNAFASVGTTDCATSTTLATTTKSNLFPSGAGMSMDIRDDENGYRYATCYTTTGGDGGGSYGESQAMCLGCKQQADYPSKVIHLGTCQPISPRHITHTKTQQNYDVIAVAPHTETLELMVTYREKAARGWVFTRPLVMFTEPVVLEFPATGEMSLRFVPALHSTAKLDTQLREMLETEKNKRQTETVTRESLTERIQRRNDRQFFDAVATAEHASELLKRERDRAAGDALDALKVLAEEKAKDPGTQIILAAKVAATPKTLSQLRADHATRVEPTAAEIRERSKTCTHEAYELMLEGHWLVCVYCHHMKRPT